MCSASIRLMEDSLGSAWRGAVRAVGALMEMDHSTGRATQKTTNALISYNSSVTRIY